MRIPPPPEPSPLVAFFSAPLITPVLAIPLVGLLPGIYTDAGNLLLSLPFVIIFSLMFGYIGMIAVCLPVLLALRLVKRLNALTLCTLTSLIGGTLFALRFHDMPGSEPGTAYVTSFVVGTGCSLGVSALFCALSGITIRSSRDRFAARLKW